jgi:hypothetical protein
VENCRTNYDEETHALEAETARLWTSGATIREVLVLRHADQELINRALDRLPVEFCEVMVLRELLNATDLKKLSADIDKLEDVEMSSSTIPSVTRPMRLSCH